MQRGRDHGRPLKPPGAKSIRHGDGSVMGEDLTLAELARRVGEPPERLRQWTSLRLVGRDGREAYDATDIERILVIQLLLRRGFNLEEIARANDEETLLDRHVELAFPDR